MTNSTTTEQPIDIPKPTFDQHTVFKGGVLGIMALRAVKGKSGGITERIAKRILSKDSTALGRKVEPEVMARAETLAGQTEYWHGTGRFQYRDGEIVDVLKGVIAQGGLLPQHDDIDIVGAMQSVSLARSRTYARAYADMHEYGTRGERHGSALLWSAAFIGPLALKIVQEEKLWRPENRRRVREHFRASNSAQWYRKVRKDPTGTLGIFAYGSDIEDNYPILFGIKEGVVAPTQTSKSVAVHEVRSTEPISFADLTHIEVPESKVAETQAMLTGAGFEVPVMAIEDFEARSATLPFKQLVT